MYELRPLRLTDREDVLEIARHTWEGHDYIPYLFDTWLEDRHSFTAAIEQDGHVVALANLRVIENGKTGWMEGLRVHPDHRGQGLASILTHHVVKMAEEIPVERIRYTTAIDNKQSLHLGESVGMERKFDLAVHWQEQMDEVSWTSSVSPVKETSIEEIYPHLIESKLLPHNVIIYDWKALDCSLDALKKIASLGKFWIQSKQGKIQSVSFGFKREDPTGLQWSFTAYAKDDAAFLDQLAHHVRMTSDTGCKSIFMTYQTGFVQTFYSLEWVRPIDGEVMALTLLERVL